MGKNKPIKYKLTVDIQCGSCGALTHQQAGEGGFPKFCPSCGAGMEKFCLRCQKKADMYFEEWWPEDDECLRTYCTPRRCSRCNAVLEQEDEKAGGEYQN